VSLELDQGDLIILTSDGVVEAFNATSEMFGCVRLEAAVASGPTSNAAAMLEHLQEQVYTFVGATEPHDDLTSVVIQV
jgi:sigma-B regulation protein RsbU (phosphoserine phosphatase)